MFHVMTIPADNGKPVALKSQVVCPDLAQLQEGVGGWLELVPHWDRDEAGRRCAAFCNEEGKLQGLPVNDRAMSLWTLSAGGILHDVLAGDIVVVSVDTDDEYEQL